LRLRAAAIAAVMPGTATGAAASEAGARDAREAYRTLLALGRAHAVPRRAHETPAEYLAAWRTALPAPEEARELTGAYTRVRYGPPAPEAVSPARFQALLARIKEALLPARPRA
jgi:hypothetical protein